MGKSVDAVREEERPGGPTSLEFYRLFAFLVVALILGLLLYRGVPVMSGGSMPPVRLVIYGFSTQEEAFSRGIFPAFEATWEGRTGRDLIIDGVFGPSGTLANQIVLGAPADVAIFSNAQHVTWLQVGRKVEEDTRAELIGCTPMVIVTRPGNPLEISEFADLARPGLQLLHAEPGRSGAGDWALLAEYGSTYLDSGSRDTAETQVRAIWDNVKVLGSSARATLTLFELGAGDALVTYEQDALLALDRQIPVELVWPARTIVAQHMVVIVDANVTRSERMAAEDFVHYLLSEAGQELLRQYHLRPAEFNAGVFASIPFPFTIEDLGGWPHAYHDVIDGLWKGSIAPQLTKEPLPKLLNGQD